jgi:hypothetical protein
MDDFELGELIGELIDNEHVVGDDRLFLRQMNRKCDSYTDLEQGRIRQIARQCEATISHELDAFNQSVSDGRSAIGDETGEPVEEPDADTEMMPQATEPEADATATREQSDMAKGNNCPQCGGPKSGRGFRHAAGCSQASGAKKAAAEKATPRTRRQRRAQADPPAAAPVSGEALPDGLAAAAHELFGLIKPTITVTEGSYRLRLKIKSIELIEE